MTAPQGEGIQEVGDLDLGLLLPEPKFELLQPKTAPQELLDLVRVNTEGRSLDAISSIGPVSAELYYRLDDDPESDLARADFYPALSADLDPDAEANPLATQSYPYSTLPDGARYEVAIRTPLEAAKRDWSEGTIRDIHGGLPGFGISLGEFRSHFPGVDVDHLPEGRYTVTATERTRSRLAIAARVENGEPLTRVQTVSGDSIHYRETLEGGFQQSYLHPETAVCVINSRTTIQDNGEDADRQRLEFRQHDGFQRTGTEAEEHSGLVEVVLGQATEVELSDFTFAQEKPYIPPSYDDFGGRAMKSFGGGDFLGLGTTRGGLTGGETRYRPPETIKVSMGGVRDFRPVAAFRFALAGEAVTPSAES